jgi:ABC-type glycerol-3-phosphate transport system substrate-binding protein
MTAFLLGLSILIIGALYLWFSPSHKSPRIDTTADPLTFREGGLRIWALAKTSDLPAFQKTLSDFEAARHVAVDVVRFETMSLLRQAMDSENARSHPPDLVFVDAALAALLDEQKRLELQILPDETKETLRLEALSPFRNGMALRAWPTDLSLRCLFYNRTVLESQGLAEPGPHWNWDTLLGMARTLYRPDEPPANKLFWGLEMPLDVEMWNLFAAQSGAPLYSGNTFHLGDPESAMTQARALEHLLSFFQLYAILPPPIPKEGKTAFEDGNAAFLIADSTTLDRLKKTSFQWGVTCLPRGESRASPLHVYGWAVIAHNAHPELARQLVQNLSSQPALVGSLGAQTDSTVEPGWTEALTQALAESLPPPTSSQADLWIRTVEPLLVHERTLTKTDGLLFVERAASLLHSPETENPLPR